MISVYPLVRMLLLIPDPHMIKNTKGVSSSPGVPLRATLTWSALRVDADTQESVVELL
nr:hypothetical protein [Tanacetum cinerariifolium]